MPSWPAETKYISHSTQRIDGEAKVTGRARYASDIQAEGWLYGMILRSKWPAAKISAMNLDKARALPGIKAAVKVLRRRDCGGRRHQQAGVSGCVAGDRSYR